MRGRGEVPGSAPGQVCASKGGCSIQLRFREPVSVSPAQGADGRDQAVHGFRRRQGISPIACRNGARLRWAAALLGEGGQAGRARRLGFADPSPIAGASRSQFGKVPTEPRITSGAGLPALRHGQRGAALSAQPAPAPVRQAGLVRVDLGSRLVAKPVRPRQRSWQAPDSVDAIASATGFGDRVCPGPGPDRAPPSALGHRPTSSSTSCRVPPSSGTRCWSCRTSACP